MPPRAARLDWIFLAGGRRSKIPLRRSESFPNFATVRAAAIRGGARGRRPAGAEGGWGRGGEGGLRAPIQRSTPFGRRGPVQCKARAPPLPGVAGSGFGSQFKNLNPKRCTDPKMSKRHRTSPKKAFGSGHKTTRKVYRPTRKWPNSIGLLQKKLFGSGSTDPKMWKPPRASCKKSLSNASAPIRRNRKLANRLQLPIKNDFSMVSGLVRSSRRLANRVGLPAKQTVSRVSFCHRGCALRGVGVRAGARMFSPFHGGL